MPKSQTVLDGHDTALATDLYMSFELSNKVWKLTLSDGRRGPAFIDRFFLHVLPNGFKRIRHYGLLAPAHKTQRLAQARSALAAPTPEQEVIESVAAFMDRVAGIDSARCPACAGHFVVTAVIAPQRLHGPLAHGPP